MERHLKTTWFNMPLHGGRCEEWSSYEVFKKWALDNGYTIFSGIRRIDCTKPFCPNNTYFDNKLEIQILDIRKRRQKLKKFVEESIRNNFSFVEKVELRFDVKSFRLFIESDSVNPEIFKLHIDDLFVYMSNMTKSQSKILSTYLKGLQKCKR